MPNTQYNSWRGCALSVAMPQALRQLLETLLRSLSTSAQYPIPKLVMQDFLKQTIITPIVGNIAIAFFSVLVMFLKTFFPNSISGTYLQLFF